MSKNLRMNQNHKHVPVPQLLHATAKTKAALLRLQFGKNLPAGLDSAEKLVLPRKRLKSLRDDSSMLESAQDGSTERSEYYQIRTVRVPPAQTAVERDSFRYGWGGLEERRRSWPATLLRATLDLVGRRVPELRVARRTAHHHPLQSVTPSKSSIKGGRAAKAQVVKAAIERRLELVRSGEVASFATTARVAETSAQSIGADNAEFGDVEDEDLALMISNLYFIFTVVACARWVDDDDRMSRSARTAEVPFARLDAPITETFTTKHNHYASVFWRTPVLTIQLFESRGHQERLAPYEKSPITPAGKERPVSGQEREGHDEGMRAHHQWRQQRRAIYKWAARPAYNSRVGSQLASWPASLLEPCREDGGKQSRRRILRHVAAANTLPLAMPATSLCARALGHYLECRSHHALPDIRP
ncbi:hypothetical protein BDZ89DRAFT_1185741 [Hymenopellis radicata]|nr:hypothetical protein BDZ89DRAFT_1185741 [Hymenopellis radicata]